MNIATRSSTFPSPPRRQRQWVGQLDYLKQIVAGIALMSAYAESDEKKRPGRSPFSASLAVVPSIAPVNRARLLTITAHFPLGCGPTGASASIATENGITFLEVRLDQPAPDFAFSDLVLVPYAVEVAYTPTKEGDLPVRMLTSDGALVGESVVMTRAIRGDDVEFDVTGKWIDPVSKETGLAFVPDFAQQESVVGTWNFHDHQGVSHRYSIESVHWKQPNVEAEGAIFETTSNGANAPSPDLPAPAPANAHQVGRARIMFHGLDSARIFALGFGGNVLVASHLVRSAT
ncbi:MAG: hypothetical protein ABL931_03495 [Usitatibacteraceae bacterium]